MDIADALGLNTLLSQLILAVGLAMVLGNGYAIYKHRKGEAPKGVQGEFRGSRAVWLLVVGIVLTVWGGASLFL